ncbi:hypothetical protein [Campylobacter sp. RM16187]|uniref:hypothetical protein n=1 Tax=Campylobacter sp. RM16187 TaxID=1660063 RepID=UPI0021B693C6|nr:hypothetical protein [Campylobacter sp. RM16187]
MNKMLKEIFITPEVFLKSNMSVNNFYNLKSLLENIKNGGFVLSLENKDWIKYVLSNISSCIPQHRDLLSKLISHLKDRERIEFQPKIGIEPQTEDDWLKIAQNINSIKRINSIFSNKATDYTLTLNHLDSIDLVNEYGYNGSIKRVKTEKELEKIFSIIVAYAKKVTIIDPYFYLHIPRYKVSLEIIAKNFGERRNNKICGNIIIHCRFQENEYGNFQTKLKKWQEVCNFIYSKYGHIITIFVWKEKIGNIKMHDRYLITNQVGLLVAAGLDKDDNQESEFSLKLYEELSNITSPFDRNNPLFDLAFEVTSSSIKTY